MENGLTRHDPLAPLVARVVLGEEEALRALYEAAGPLAMGIASRILVEETEAEDAVVDVFVQVWRQAERFDRSRGSALTWIAALARTRAIDRLRRRDRERPVALDAETAQNGKAHERHGPPEVCEVLEEEGRMRRAVDALPHDQRRAIEAAFYGGLSHSEVAVELGLPLGTVKTRIRTGLATLRREFTKALDDHA